MVKGVGGERDEPHRPLSLRSISKSLSRTSWSASSKPAIVELRPAKVGVGRSVGESVALVLALAVDAGVRVRQGVDPRLVDLPATIFATAVDAGGDAFEGMLDLAEFTALELGELRADFIVGRIDRRVDVVAHVERGMILAQRVEIARKARAAGRRGGQPASREVGARNRSCGPWSTSRCSSRSQGRHKGRPQPDDAPLLGVRARASILQSRWHRSPSERRATEHIMRHGQAP